MTVIPTVSVIIPTWNGAHLLKGCLSALSKQDWSDFEIIVVDNGSDDGTVEQLSSLSEDVKWLRLERNEGFSRAINLGVANARAPWLAILNNDTAPTAGWLSALVLATRKHPEAAIFASKMVSLRRPGFLDDVGNAYTRTGRAFKVGYGELDYQQYEQERVVFGACFGAALVRRDVYESLGGLDEDFFAYYEDVDFCFRARLIGHHCLYEPKAVVGHYGGATQGGSVNEWTVRLSTRNALWVMARNMPTALLLRYWPRIFLEWGLLYPYWASRGLGAAYLHGVWEGVRQWLTQRRLGRKLRLEGNMRVTGLVQIFEAGETEVRFWRSRRRSGSHSKYANYFRD